MSGPVVVLGAGQAGLQVALSLREAGFAGDVSLVGDEAALPYQRPPLSKAFLLGKVAEEGLHLRRREVIEDQAIRLLSPARAITIDRARRSVTLDIGIDLPYGHLVLATGTRNRGLAVPGAKLNGVVYLRSLVDAGDLRSRLDQARSAVVVGAGFIGLEFAAIAAARGLRVHVVEAGARVMARAVSPEISTFFTRQHAGRGTTFSFEAGVAAIEGRDGRVDGVTLRDGKRLNADLVLIGIGVLPNDELAREAGLAVDNGIVTDAHLVTSDPAISAIGDCAAHPNHHAGAMTRLESVQNAIDGAKIVAARICGRPEPYRSVPWFWSDQGPDKLQIAGLTAGADVRVMRGDEASARFSVFCFRAGRLVGVETVNRPADHMAARKALRFSRLPTPEAIASEDFDLRAFAQDGAAAA